MANIIRRGEPQQQGWEPMRLMRDLFDWDPYAELRGPERRGMGGQLMFVPAFEVKETKDAYVFKADLPGVDDKDIDITVSGNRLTVTGKREAEEREKDENYFLYERQFGAFTRSFTLPEGVDPDHVEAEMKGGVMTITVPKRPEHQPKKISLRSVVDEVKSAVKGQS
jgi:HSP20 family protein